MPFDGRDPFARRWYIAKVEPTRERAFREELARSETPFLVFLPIEVPRLGEDAKTGKPCVANPNRLRFPGYGFVAMDLDQDPWGRVLRAKHVSHLLPAEGNPLPVIGSIMDRLIASDIAYSRVTVDELVARMRRKRVAFEEGDDVQWLDAFGELRPGEVEVDEGRMITLLSDGKRVKVQASRVRAA